MRPVLWILLAGTLGTASAGPDPAAERASVAGDVLADLTALHDSGMATADDVFVWSERVAEAEAAAGKKGAADRHVDRMRALEKDVQQKLQTGMATPVEAAQARYYVLTAEAGR